MNSFFFFFNDTATTEIYTLSLHDALPICLHERRQRIERPERAARGARAHRLPPPRRAEPADAVLGILGRSEEHTSELQSQSNLVCRLLLEKKKTANIQPRLDCEACRSKTR